MKMHHLDKEKVEAIMLKVKQVVESGQYPRDVIEEGGPDISAFD